MSAAVEEKTRRGGNDGSPGNGGNVWCAIGHHRSTRTKGPSGWAVSEGNLLDKSTYLCLLSGESLMQLLVNKLYKLCTL